MSPKQVLNISPIFFFQKTDRLAKNGARVTLCFAMFCKKYARTFTHIVVNLHRKKEHRFIIYPYWLRRVVGATLRRFSRDCSGAVCDGKLKFSKTGPPFMSDITNRFLFWSQIRSLTYGIISKPQHSHKMSQLRSTANDRQSFSGRRNFEKVALGFCM